MASTEADSFQIGAFTVAKNASARELADKLNRLREAVDQCRLQPGVGYTLNRSPGGTTLCIKAGGAGGAAVPDPHPWQVFVVTENRRRYFRVTTGSVLDGVSVENLGGLVAIEDNTPGSVHCVLQVPLNASLQPGTAAVVAVPQTEYLGSVEPENERQTKCNKILATLQADGVLVQAVRRNMALVLANNGGFAAKIALEEA